jgi:serine/threonine protein kinase
MGSVYRAIDLPLNRFCAVREVPLNTLEFARQFQLEGGLLATLNHPNLPRLFNHFIDGHTSSAYLVTDYIAGDDLESIVRQRGPLPEQTVIQVAVQILDAVIYLHSRQPPIIHRNIKPSNVKIDSNTNWRSVLVDFGVAREIKDLHASTRRIAATPGYAPLEQYSGGTDPRSDLYSLGATLYFALTGQVPPEVTLRVTVDQVPVSIRQFNPAVSEQTERVILRAMAVQPLERWQSALEMQQVLFRPAPITVPTAPIARDSFSSTSSTLQYREGLGARIQRNLQNIWRRFFPSETLLEEKIGDVEKAVTTNGILQIAREGTWLAGRFPGNWQATLRAVHEISQRAQAAVEGETLYNKRTQWQKAYAQAGAVIGELKQNQSIFANRLIQGLTKWETLFQKELAGLQEAIPNVYVAGTPLATASKVFKGRRDLFIALENELRSAAEQLPALLLHGARRTGKTSVIKQMPIHLGPEVIPVEIDLLSATVAQDATSLLGSVANQITTNARVYRGITLPELSQTELAYDPYMRFLQWVSQIERSIGQRWVLLNFDEYENLSEMLKRGRIDERIFQLLRSLIQQHPHIALLFSGSHDLSDMPSIWSNSLINVKMLHIGPLQPAEARELITQPVEGFPLKFEPGVVERILHATGCHPHLLQATCRDLVNLLNEDLRKTATLADVEQVFLKVLGSWEWFFKDLWEGADTEDKHRVIMRAIATSPNGVLNAWQLIEQFGSGANQIGNRLAHRDILTITAEGYRFQSELVQKWIQQQITRGG